MKKADMLIIDEQTAHLHKGIVEVQIVVRDKYDSEVFVVDSITNSLKKVLDIVISEASTILDVIDNAAVSQWPVLFNGEQVSYAVWGPIYDSLVENDKEQLGSDEDED